MYSFWQYLRIQGETDLRTTLFFARKLFRASLNNKSLVSKMLVMTLIASVASFSSLSVAPVPAVMAQDVAPEQSGEIDSSPPLLDGELEEPIFFDEPPTEVTSDPAAGEAGAENEVDNFPYTENVLGNYTGQESGLNAAYQMFLPTVETQEAVSDAVAVNSGGGRTFYIDCTGGSDSKSGLSKTDAWKSLRPSYDATLQPGDSLLLKRGCSWTGPLDAKWQGTSSQPIVIGAYGTGALPKIQNAYSANVRISGKYQIIQDIHATLSTPPNPDPNCNNQPRGWKSGFSFEKNSSYNTVRASKATRLTIGVFFHTNSNNNKLLNSTITDNNVLEQLTSTSAHGASGVSLHGTNQEIARNYFANNRSICTYNGVQESISIELYTASNANIHHNTIYNDRVFIELGSTSTWRSENNTIAYNLYVSNYAHATMGARFVVTRGYGHSYGPVVGTKVINNVVYLTGAGSKGVTCQKCDTGILTVRNNILWANDEPFSSDNSFVETNNVYWSNDGSPSLQWRGLTKSSSSYIANPQFVNAGANNFSLQSSSPAINRGTIDFVAAGYVWDLAGKQVPIAGAVDIGAFEAQ